MNKFRIFVGTMYTQEGDFLKSKARIQEQKDVLVTHFIISDLKEKEAHNVLWRAWKDQRSNHDLFVKIDADTILRSETTLKTIAELFQQNSRVTGMQAPLHDYMTNSHINGLNAFSPKVTFNATQDELYCDRQVDTDHDIVLRGTNLPADLIPAGYHCHYSTESQAFHYGVHRMLKGQTDIINQVMHAWHDDQDRIRGFALIGASMSGMFAHNKRFNYSDAEFKAAFEQASAAYNQMVDVWRVH